MTPRDALGMVCIAVGMATGLAAWALRDFWWGIGGALLLTVGFAIIWTRERDGRLREVAADLHDDGLGWRVRGRRDDRDDDWLDADD